MTQTDRITNGCRKEITNLLKNHLDEKLQNSLKEEQKQDIVELISDVLFKNPQAVVEAAEKELATEDRRATGWAVVLLIFVGSIVVIATLAFQFGLLQLLLDQLPSKKDLPTSEFITAISLGTILVAFGGVFLALLRMHQLEARAESVRIHLKNRAQIIQTLAESAPRRLLR